MGNNIPTVIPADAPPGAVRQLANGTWIDGRGKFLKGSRPSNIIASPQDARNLAAARYQRKQATIAAAAQAAVQSGQLNAAHGDMAWVAEIAQAQMMLATTPDAGVASTRAADWLIINAGMGETRQDTAAQAVGAVADVIGALAAFAAAITQQSVDISNDDATSEDSGTDTATGGWGEG